MAVDDPQPVDPEWIEVELTDAEPARQQRDRRSPGRAAAGSGRRTAAIATAVGAAALVTGWLLGSAGDDDAAGDAGAAGAATSTATTVAEPVTTPPADVLGDLTLVELEPAITTTTARPRRPTTTQPEYTVNQAPIEVAEPLAGLPYEIVGLRRDGLTIVDLATAEVTSVEYRMWGQHGQLLAGDEWVAVSLLDQPGAARLVVYDQAAATVERVELAAGESVVHARGAATMWVLDEDFAVRRGGGTVVEVSPHGEETGRTVALPGRPRMLDVAGNWVIDAAGDVFTVSADGASTRLTPGTLLALGANHAIVAECDERAVCDDVMIDRRSGARRALPGLASAAATYGWWGMPSEPVSPDGRWAVLDFPEYEAMDGGYVSTPHVSIVDLTTGDVHQFDDIAPGMPSPVRWSDDSRFLFRLVGGEVIAYEPTTGDSFPVTPDVDPPIEFESFEIRPSHVDGSRSP